MATTYKTTQLLDFQAYVNGKIEEEQARIRAKEEERRRAEEEAERLYWLQGYDSHEDMLRCELGRYLEFGAVVIYGGQIIRFRWADEAQTAHRERRRYYGGRCYVWDTENNKARRIW